MRFLVLYLRSRQIPAAFAVALLSVAGLWALNLRGTGPLPGVLAVLAGAVAAGPGLAGADLDLDRTAAIAWPPRRAAHLLATGTIVTGLLAATALTAKLVAPTTHVLRDTIGISGLLALGAAILGAARAWIPPLASTLLAWTLLTTGPPATRPTYQQALTWMFQPAGSTPATVTAILLGATGTLTYALLGPGPPQGIGPAGKGFRRA